MRQVMSSAEIARVVEIPQPRNFDVGEEGFAVRVVWNHSSDELYCDACHDWDNCEHTSRVRLCGIITHTVTADVLTRPKLEIQK